MAEALTKAQRDQLERLATLRLPLSLSKYGWPGFPQSMVDLRCMAALEKRAYVESGIHTFKRRWDVSATHGIWWRITDAGRAALQPKDPQHD